MAAEADFFDEVDSTGIVENHIKEALGLENSEARKILERYNDIRKDLVDRLSALPRGSFTAQHLRGVLAQVQGAIIAMNKHLGGTTVEGSQKAAMLGVNGMLKEMKAFDEKFTGAVTPINLNAALIATDTANLLVTKYKTNLDNYGQNLYTQISNGLFSAAIGETNYDQVVGRVSQFFKGKEWELHRIIRTELHNVFNLGKLNAMEEVNDDVEDMLKTLMHPMDARTGKDSKYAARLKLVAALDEPFEYSWEGVTRTFMSPPDRPNDRAILVPYRKEWGKLKSAAFIPFTD